MKTLRTAAIALALAADAAVAALPTVSAGDNAQPKTLQAGPIPACPPGDPNGCGIYDGTKGQQK